MKNSIPNKKHSIDLVGIGNAIVDLLVKVDDDFLEKHSLTKGNMHLINEKQAEELYLLIKSDVQTSGGSAANTLASFAELGGICCFIGRVKDDELGSIFTNEIKSVGTLFETPSVKQGPSTARCFIFVTPDAQRTMCTYLGASILLESDDIDFSVIDRSKILYLEGYLWDNSSAKSAFLAAANKAKNCDCKVALSLSDSFCVERHRESFLELIENHIDILFSNEDEIKSLYDKPDLSNALESIKDKCPISIITRGAKGSIIISENEIITIDAITKDNIIDTTGAGDLYAGGFLFGYSKGKDLFTCGKIGSICAGQIITQLGSRSDVPLKSILQNSNVFN